MAQNLDAPVWQFRSDRKVVYLPDPGTAFSVLITGSIPQGSSEETVVSVSVMFGDSVMMQCAASIKWQGQSSLGANKKSYKLAWQDDDGNDVDVKFGSWLPAGKVDLKGFGSMSAIGNFDRTMARDVISAQIWRNIRSAYSWPNNRIAPLSAWYAAESDMSGPPVGALFSTDGKPCDVYLNGVFAGVFVWRTAAPVSDYVMSKSNPDHILVQPQHGPGDLWSNWSGTNSSWEFDSPKKPDTTSLKSLITYFGGLLDGSTSWGDFRKFTDFNSWIDYTLFCALVASFDSQTNNLYLASWDGGKHYHVCAYDLDETIGIVWGGKSATCEPEDLAIPATQNSFWNAFYQNFGPEIRARYAVLRYRNVISQEAFVGLLDGFFKRIDPNSLKADSKLWGTNDQSSYAYMADWMSRRIAWLDAQWGYSA
ncbi:CotH kinase family protein [Gluconobacter cerinus]|uniref:CotH kinase family protein n=1 Tax=Gluconobacter cerinus TaxID=38307 RepID=UPI001B8DA296|nr:CotH kinase family protein [Gluconobacter cerinus]MBS1026065.1 CotH kinase family protein [Gluconobacter cerinus]